MSALDNLLAQTVASVIRKNLGEKSYAAIETRLRERYDLTVVEAIKDFTKFDATLREFFAAGADSIEMDVLSKLFTIDSSKKGAAWITIENKELAEMVLATYGDREKRMILSFAFKNPSPILDIIEGCDIPKSTGYRLIGELVDAGFLTESGHSTTTDGRRVSIYTALFYQVKFDVDLDDTEVHVLLKEDILKESNLVRVLQGRY